MLNTEVSQRIEKIWWDKLKELHIEQQDAQWTIFYLRYLEYSNIISPQRQCIYESLKNFSIDCLGKPCFNILYELAEEFYKSEIQPLLKDLK